MCLTVKDKRIMKKLSELDITEIKDFFEINAGIQSIQIKSYGLNASPRLTIAIPTYKRIGTLKEAIDSALAQKNICDYEVLVIDNNPERNDETELFIMSHYADESKLSYYKNVKNLGMTGNWNRMCELALGEWISMLHDDDMLFPDSMFRSFKIIDSLQSEIDILFLNSVSDINYKSSSMLSHFYCLNAFDFFMDNRGTIAGVLMKKMAVMELGGFDASFYPTADYYFWAKMAILKKAYRVCDAPDSFYRIGENTSCNVDIIDKMVASASRVQFSIADYMLQNSLFRYILRKKVECWCFNYLFAWKKTFGNDNNFTLVDEKIKSARLRYSVKHKVIDRLFYYVLRIVDRLRKKQVLSLDI